MSEVMTIARLPGRTGEGLMDYGRLTRAEIIARLRKKATRDLEAAQRTLNAADGDFEVRVVRGINVQRLIEKLEP